MTMAALRGLPSRLPRLPRLPRVPARFAPAVRPALIGVVLVAIAGIWEATLAPSDRVLLGTVLFGVVVGCLNALLAAGLVLIYRSSRVINFAQGDVGGTAAVLFIELVAVGWAYPAAAVVALLAGLLSGAAVEMLVIRRFQAAPRLLVMVATLALGQVFSFMSLFLPVLIGGRVAFNLLPSPLTRFHFVVAPARFDGNDILIVAVTLVAVSLLGIFLKRTPYGLAVRAAAENGERATLCGVPIRSLSTLVWTLAAGLSALAAVLQAPVLGVPIGTPPGPTLLLRGLAAAVIGRMESLPVTITAAIGLGIFQQAVQWAYHNETLPDALLVVVIVVGLLLQRRNRARYDADDSSSWKAVAEVRPIPRELMRMALVRYGRAAVYALLVAAAVLLPLGMSVALQEKAAVILIWGMVAVSLVVLTGWSGQISLGQFGLVAVGAVTAGRVALMPHGDFLLALLAGAAAGAAASLLIGLPALRLRGFFLAAVTLAFGVTTYTVLVSQPPFLPSGLIDRPLLFGRIDLHDDRSFYWFCLAVLIATLAALTGLRRSRAGRAIVGVRDNERAAQAYGVGTVRTKLQAFAVSGAVAGLAGALLLFSEYRLQGTAFTPEYSIQSFAAAALGGIGSLGGALAGTLYVKGAEFILPAPWQLLATGLGLLLLLLMLPGGIGALFFRLRDGLLRAAARRRGVVVPSMLADVRVAAPPPPASSVAEPEVTVVGAGRSR